MEFVPFLLHHLSFVVKKLAGVEIVFPVEEPIAEQLTRTAETEPGEEKFIGQLLVRLVEIGRGRQSNAENAIHRNQTEEQKIDQHRRVSMNE